jgi:SAP domain-containing ribonucleoprotein
MTAAATAVAPTGTPTSRNSTAEETKPVADEELEKRKQRAARFGVPLVDPPRSYPAGRRSSTNRIHDAAPIPRAAAHATIRQVAANAATSNRKRPAVVEEVDAEELERRKKRAERFAIVRTSVLFISTPDLSMF